METGVVPELTETGGTKGSTDPGESLPGEARPWVRIELRGPDPAAVEGDDHARAAAFAQAHRIVKARLLALLALPAAVWEDRASLKQALDRIGLVQPADDQPQSAAATSSMPGH